MRRPFWALFAVSFVGISLALFFILRLNIKEEYFHQGPFKIAAQNLVHDGCRNKTCVVSFSIYGSDPQYLQGALANIQLLRIHLPHWTVRFYHNLSLPQDFVKQLNTPTSSTYLVPNFNHGPISGMFWRFLIADDESVDRYIVRDADSSISRREIVTLNEWIASG
eukprot:GILI01048997.1.p1 GENE.GILI01048997.1~~GILI01048997.1.p1  ORF type:complete len:177 (+),score=20.90 GILI01048997.1:39-533(+)